PRLPDRPHQRDPPIPAQLPGQGARLRWRGGADKVSLRPGANRDLTGAAMADSPPIAGRTSVRAARFTPPPLLQPYPLLGPWLSRYTAGCLLLPGHDRLFLRSWADAAADPSLATGLTCLSSFKRPMTPDGSSNLIGQYRRRNTACK